MKDIAARLRPALGEPAFIDASVLLYACEHETLANAMRGAEVQADAMIVDAPYSARTHAGHDGGAAQVNRKIRKANGVKDTARPRRDLNYTPWTFKDVEAFVETWFATDLVRGWSVSLTDSDLVNDWRGAFEAWDRLGFQPVPCIETGATVRLCGGGPSSWACYAAVCRPRTKEWAAWPTLCGAYVVPSEPKPWVGGKPVQLVCEILLDYTLPGHLVVDPCCGAATLAVACRRVNRCALLCDRDPAAIDCAAKRLRGEKTKATRDDMPGDIVTRVGGRDVVQPALFGGGGRDLRTDREREPGFGGPECFGGTDDPREVA